MQRWIALAVVVVLLLLAAGGAFYARRTYYENSPAPMWVPIEIKADRPPEEVDRVVKELKTKLSEDEVLGKVVQDLNLAKAWNFSGEMPAVAELRKRLFVKVGEMDSQLGKVPAIHVGVRGKAKERDLSGKIAIRLMEDVSRILGLKPRETN